ncbi:MAG: hypothetical protein GY953_11890 [bacterium]|nr:hypothetical protein [bacterium]
METTAVFEEHYLSRPTFALVPSDSSSSRILTRAVISNEAEANPAPGEFRIFDGVRRPLADGSFDLALASWLLPHRVHLRLANRLRGLAGDARDPHPTHCRAPNSPRASRRYAGPAGLTPVPDERAVNSRGSIEGFRMTTPAAPRKSKPAHGPEKATGGAK